MIRRTLTAAMVAGCILSSAASAWAGPTSVEQLKEVAQAYVKAQFSFDQATLRRLTAEEFVEVSPKGEVDERDAVIGFYAPEKRVAAPPYVVQDQRVRLTGDLGVITQRVTIGSPPRLMSLSQVLTVSRIGRDWKLTSSQSTPMSPARPAPKPTSGR